VHLVDSHLCADPGKYLSAVLLSLTTMLHLGLPHINVLSKIDLLPTYGPLAFSLEFYAGFGDMMRLAQAINAQPHMGRYAKLTTGLCELCEDYKLVSFATLDVQDEACMRRLVGTIDKSNGFVFSALERQAATKGEVSLPQMYSAGPIDWAAALQDVQERLMQDDVDSLDYDA
jgi:GPN-loop GTPase